MGLNGLNRCFVSLQFVLVGAIETCRGMSLRFDGNLGGAFIWVVFKFVVDVCGVVWCGGWGEMKQRQEVVASGAVLV